MTYLKMSAPKNVYSSFVQGEPKNQAPFTNPVLPKVAPNQFQQQVVSSLAANPQASGGAYGIVGNPLTSTTTAGQPMYSANISNSSSGGGGGGGGGGAAGPNPNALYDPTTDPIYQRIVALGQKQVSDAVAGGDALRKQILIQLGDPKFAHSQQFGDPNAATYGDATTEQAADQNPYSTMKQLAATHTNNLTGIDQSTNRNGLFWSSTHANQLGDENMNYNTGISNADNAAGSQLSNIVQQILQAQNTAEASKLSAMDTATQNAINLAIQSGYAFGGFDASGKPIFTPGAGYGGGYTGGGSTDGGASGTVAANTPSSSGGQSGTANNNASLNAYTQPYNTSPLIQAIASQSRNSGYGKGNVLQ